MKHLLFSLAFLLATQIHAQFVSVPYTMRTPGGNITMNQHVYMPMNYGGGTRNPKFEFLVKLKNDSVFKMKSRIEAKDKKMYIHKKQRKKDFVVKPGDTQSIMKLSHAGNLAGIPADSCWLFVIEKSAIRCYSSVPIESKYNTIAVQKGNDGAIVPLNKKNLKELLNTTDEKILKWIERDRLIDAVERYNKLAAGNK